MCKGLGKGATLHCADHSFHVPKSSGQADSDVLDELASTVVDWVEKLEGRQKK